MSRPRAWLWVALSLSLACGGNKASPKKVSQLTGTIASAAQACAEMPLSTTGTIYYACDCQAGADPSCQAGDDSNPGTDPSKPWRSYDKAQSAFLSMNAGDTVAFCRGGAITGDTKTNWVNANCKAATPCTVRDYTPPGAKGDLPLPVINGGKINLNNNGNATHEEGYQFLNLYLDGGSGYPIEFGVLAGNDVTDVLICDVTITRYQTGIYVANSNPPASGSDGKNARITLKGSQIVDNSNMGWLGACNDCSVEYNMFDHNGAADALDHNVYFSNTKDGNGNLYTATGEKIIGNAITHSAQGTGNQCTGNPLVVHGTHDGILIQGNTISQDIGTAGGGCWGIAVGPGYAGEAEAFTNVVVSGNLITNVGNISILMASCQNCVIEDNLIVQGQTDFNSTGIQVELNGDRESIDLPMTAVQVLNNTIYFESDASPIRGITVGQEGTDYVISSNLILAATAKTLDCVSYDLAPTAYHSDYNLCWNTMGAVGAWEYKTNDSLSAWQAATGLDMHSMIKDPMVKAAALTSYDFTPATGSPLIGAGDPADSSPADFAGSQRPAPADIGAFQH